MLRWRQIYALANKRFKLVAHAALSAMSIPLSNAAAERSFSVLASLEGSKARLHGTQRYVSTCVKLRFNRLYVAKANAFRMTGVDKGLTEACAGFLSTEERAALELDLHADPDDVISVG